MLQHPLALQLMRHWHHITHIHTELHQHLISSVQFLQGRRLRGDEGYMSPNIPTGDAVLHAPPPKKKLISQCMPLSSLTGFHSIQLQK